MSFDTFGLSEPVAESLRRQSFTQPTTIQEQSLPPLLQGRDVLGRAETGSGKTLAFGIPLIEKIESGRVSIQALVILPTRELAQQVAEDLRELGREKGVKVALVVGGVHVRTQRMQIPGCQIVVGTPGRIVDLLEDRFLPVEWVEYFVLDEFDRLLEMGFIDDVKKIVKRLPRERQSVLFSATVPREILKHAHEILSNPVIVETGGSGIVTVATAVQRAIRCPSSKKLATLEKLLDVTIDDDGTVVVFCNTKKQVRQVDRELWAKDYSVAALSGDHEQSVRFKVMERFRNREIRVLVATDVAARGLDIDHIGHVINYDVPSEVEDYVHRIGRTARAGRDGIVTSIVGDEDVHSFGRIRRQLDHEIEMLTPGNLGAAVRPARPDALETEEPPVVEERKPSARSTAAFGVIVDDSPAQVTDKRRDGDPTTAADGDETPDDERSGGDDRPKRRRRGRGRKGKQERPPAEAGTDDRREPAPQRGEDRSGDSKRQDSDRGRRPGGNDGGGERKRSRRGGRGRGKSGSAGGEGPPRKDREGGGRGDDKKPGRRRHSGEGRSGDNRSGDGRASDGRPADNRSSAGNRRDNQEGERDDRGRRSRGSYRRWEEDQLNKPVSLMEDNWERVDDIARASSSEERDKDHGNRPVVEGALDAAVGPLNGEARRRGRRGGARRRRG